MTRAEAIEQIIDDLSQLQLRTQGFGDWRGEIDLEDLAESIYRTAREASEDQP